MPGTAKAAKLISFKLQEGKSQEEAIEALKAIMQHFTQQPGGQSGTLMHHEESDTFYIYGPADSMESLESQGKAMIASGVGTNSSRWSIHRLSSRSTAPSWTSSPSG